MKKKKIYCICLSFFTSFSSLFAYQYVNPVKAEAYQGYKGCGGFVESPARFGDYTGYVIGVIPAVLISEPLRLFGPWDREGDDIGVDILSGTTKTFGCIFGGPSYGLYSIFSSKDAATRKKEVAELEKKNKTGDTEVIVNPALLTYSEKNEKKPKSLLASRVSSEENQQSAANSAATEKRKNIEVKPKLSEQQVDKKVKKMKLTKKEQINLGLAPQAKSKESIMTDKRISSPVTRNTATEEREAEDTKTPSWNTPELPDWVKKEAAKSE